MSALTCVACGQSIPDGVSFMAVFMERRADNEHGTIRIVGGCHLHPIPDVEKAIGITGSEHCLLSFLADCLAGRAGAS